MEQGWSQAIKYCVRYGDNYIDDFSTFDQIFTSNSCSFITNNGNHILHFLAICKSQSLLLHVLPYVKKYINYTNVFNETPLHIACNKGSLETVKILIHYGASLKITDQDNNSMLHLAVQGNNIDIVKYLIRSKKFPLDYKNIYNMSPLDIACNENHIKILKYLLYKNVNIDTLLFKYTKENNYTIVKVLSNYISKNQIILLDSDNKTPLHYALGNNCYKIAKIFMKNNILWCKQKDINGKTPYDLIISSKNSKFKSLLNHFQNDI